MHFTQIITAAVALPALGMAAALPQLAPRQTITRDCLSFSFLSVGALTMANNNVYGGDAVVQLKPEGSGEDSWQTKAFLKKGAKAVPFDIASNTGVKHLRVCKADISQCHFPVNRNPNMRWDFKIGGDRWFFALDVMDGSDGDIQGVCGVSGSNDKVTAVPAPLPTTTTTSTATLTTTTSSKITTASETTLTKTTTTKTSTSKTTTKSSTKTSTSSAKATTTCSGRNC